MRKIMNKSSLEVNIERELRDSQKLLLRKKQEVSRGYQKLLRISKQALKSASAPKDVKFWQERVLWCKKNISWCKEFERHYSASPLYIVR
jgi:hypothetical protein